MGNDRVFTQCTLNVYKFIKNPFTEKNWAFELIRISVTHAPRVYNFETLWIL